MILRNLSGHDRFSGERLISLLSLLPAGMSADVRLADLAGIEEGEGASHSCSDLTFFGERESGVATLDSGLGDDTGVVIPCVIERLPVISFGPCLVWGAFLGERCMFGPSPLSLLDLATPRWRSSSMAARLRLRVA